MKTPKRPDAPIIDEAEYDSCGIPTGDITTYWDCYHEAHARWKRKNKIKQLKRTIAKLNRKLDAVLRANEWLSNRYRFARKIVEKHCPTQLPESTLPCNVIFLEVTTGAGAKMNWLLTTDHNATIDDCVDVCIAAENHFKTTKEP
jgi:hypothetical protein